MHEVPKLVKGFSVGEPALTGREVVTGFSNRLGNGPGRLKTDEIGKRVGVLAGGRTVSIIVLGVFRQARPRMRSRPPRGMSIQSGRLRAS